MSRGINWFKDFKIEEEIIDVWFGKDITYSIEFLDSDSTSFGEGNIILYQNAFEEYGKVRIPYLEYEYGINPQEHIKEKLIKPIVLSAICSEILKYLDKEDKYNIKDRIEWFKEMSDKGYYFSFNNW